MTPETVLEYLKVIGEYLSPAYLAVRQYVIILAVKRGVFILISLLGFCGLSIWLNLWLRRGRKKDPRFCMDHGDDWYPPIVGASVVVTIFIAILHLSQIANQLIVLYAPDIPTVLWLIQQVKQP